ncbi:MAG: SDR family oxidoreductase [Euzebyaceae bacterium]|jgi:3-oxoacyl-[acyl-carrier protein] reductase|nr:SDR family oxidoreductase [Euzebyaceae bacterium]
MGRLERKRAVITGAASGIGAAAARHFAREGARVGLIDVAASDLDVVVKEIVDEGRVAVPLLADVSDEAQVSGAVDGVVDEWGGLDILVANACVFLNGQDNRAHELDLAVWQRTLDVNLTGAFLAAKHGVRAMLATGGGSVIFTGSPTGMLGVSPTFDAYSASKGGVHALMRVMARDYATDGIRVNAVIPGFTNTPSTAFIMADDEAREGLLAVIPAGRPGTAEEVAVVMAFLASDETPYVTGSFYHCDGGITAI